MISYTLYDALVLLQKADMPQGMAQNFDKNLSIALRLYVLPELLLLSESIELEQLEHYAAQVELSSIEDLVSIFDKSFAEAVKSGRVAESTGKNYRASIKRFWLWLKQQPCWIGSQSDRETVLPRQSKRPVIPGNRISRDVYGLRVELFPRLLRAEVEEFRRFRMSGAKSSTNLPSLATKQSLRKSGRKPKKKKVDKSTFDHNLQKISEFMGWYSSTKILLGSDGQEIGFCSDLFKEDGPYISVSSYFNFRYLDLAFSIARLYVDCLFGELSLALMTDIDLLDEFVFWVIENRDVCYSSGVNLVKTAIEIAKWLNYDITSSRNWHDVPLIFDLRDLKSEYEEEYKIEKKQLESEKWRKKKITHTEARESAAYLRQFCAEKRRVLDAKTGERRHFQKRSYSAIARAWQTYLIVSILVYCPVRQEEIRNLRFGETLFREEDAEGHAFYVVKLDKHKRDASGNIRHYRLPGNLTRDMDTWLFKWRPMIEASVSTLDGWLKFWRYAPNKAERYRQRLEDAKNGILPDRVTKPADEYILYLEHRLKGIERRIRAWETAKSNYERYNRVFFMFGKKGTEAFGKPFDVATFWLTVRRAFAIATQDLFGEPRWINPQALRHIAEKHVRMNGKEGIAESFGVLIGHSKEVGDKYAQQITSAYEVTEPIVNNWWHEA